LTVFAAASLRDVLRDLAHPASEACGAGILPNLGSSFDLARQILAGAPADVFLSSDEAELDRLEAAGLLVPGTRRFLATNQLVVIAPAPSPPEILALFAEPFDPARLADPRIRRLSIGDPRTVPAGRYAKTWLKSKGLFDALSGRVLPALDVRAALAAVESGACEAGIVYRTDAARSPRVRVVHAVPRTEGPPIRYAAAVIAGRPWRKEARAFLDFLGTNAAVEAFGKQGFGPPEPGQR
jgi:molybdate transport system substrate-binding protein